MDLFVRPFVCPSIILFSNFQILFLFMDTWKQLITVCDLLARTVHDCSTVCDAKITFDKLTLATEIDLANTQQLLYLSMMSSDV